MYMVFVKGNYATCAKHRPMIRRKGTRAKIASPSFTHQSAVASDTHSGTTGPCPSSGTPACAQLAAAVSAGPKKVSAAQKAVEKKISVSRAEPTSVETKGACHQAALPRRR